MSLCFSGSWWPPCPLLTWELLFIPISWGFEVVLFLGFFFFPLFSFCLDNLPIGKSES